MDYILTEEEFNQLENARGRLRLVYDLSGQLGSRQATLTSDDLATFLGSEVDAISDVLAAADQRWKDARGGPAMRMVREQITGVEDDHQQAPVNVDAEKVAKSPLASRDALGAIEAGRTLLDFKKRGGYEAHLAALPEIGLSTDVCERLITVAKRRGALTERLIKAAGSRSKLFELMALDDDDLLKLGIDGACGTLTLSGVSEMTAQGLRQAIHGVLQAQQPAPLLGD